MNRFRPELAVGLSFVLTLFIIVNAYYHKKQFYPSVVYITKSNSSMAVLYVQALVLALLIGKLMNKIFFGQLRAIELEHLFERSWYAITETCLAFTVFRDDFSPKFVTMFILLLFLKCFHWLAEDRVDYMERSPVITTTFHVRIIGLIALLAILDFNFVHIAYNHTITKGASVQLVFGFEYAILLINIISTFVKYTLHTVDLQNENPWENKGIYMLYADLILSFIRVALYLIFMTLMIKIHTFPLFAIRPMYLSLRSFKKSLNYVIMSRRAIHNLNTMYPDVTPEQLSAYEDTICIICREDMNVGTSGANQVKKLPCEHIFHKSCLRSWFQRQQTCPTCRTPILRAAVNANQNNNQQQQRNQDQQQQQQQQQPPQQQDRPAQAAAGQAAFEPSQVPRFFNFNASPTTPGASSFPPAATTPFNGFMPAFADPMLASFPLPPFAFMPPPLPPLNLSPNLTAEELAELEGDERNNVQARIHCLRNISTLLNASMVQMQQYMNMCSASSHLENITKTQNPSASVENDLRNVKLPDGTNSQEQATTSSQGDAATADETDEALRRRRLRHFESTSSTNVQK